MHFINPLMIPFIFSFYFWGRGIWKSNKYDMILGFILLLVASFFSVSLIPHSGSFSFIGPFWIIYGFISIIFKNKLDESKIQFMTQERAKLYGILIIFLGLLFSIVA